MVAVLGACSCSHCLCSTRPAWLRQLYSSQVARPFLHIPETDFFHLSFPWVLSLSTQVSWRFWLVSYSQGCTNLELGGNGTSVLTSTLGPPYLLMLEGQRWLSWSPGLQSDLLLCFFHSGSWTPLSHGHCIPGCPEPSHPQEVLYY